jgi:hypothetical protein
MCFSGPAAFLTDRAQGPRTYKTDAMLATAAFRQRHFVASNTGKFILTFIMYVDIITGYYCGVLGAGASVMSRVIFDDSILHGPPHPRTPLPQGGEGRVDFTALAPWGERVARRGAFISRGETGEGVSHMVNSNIRHHGRT